MQELHITPGSMPPECEQLRQEVRAFLAQEMLLDDEAPGPVSLWAVVGELKFMVAEHERARITT